jgi:multidrug efflux pump subunit AcrA (membrane-fusion protein)
VFTVVALIVAAGLLFYGAGVILAVAGTLVFFALPAARFARSLVALHRQRDLLLWKLSARLGLFVVFLLGMMFILPADFRSTVPAIVEYDPPTYVRAMSEGFVERVYVVDGEVVELGQPIVRLANEQLLLQLETSRVELASTQQEIRSARWNGQPSLLADAQLRLTSLESQIKELEKRVEGLTVRAKRGGRVLGRDLADRVGSWVRRGEELAVIGNESSKRLKLVLNQKDASSRREWSKRPLSVTVLGVPGWAGRISHFDERASRAVPADELIATNGGRLAVQRVEPGEASQPEDELFELTEPHLCGYVPLAPSHSQILQVGQRAYVRIARRHISIAEWLYRKVIAL